MDQRESVIIGRDQVWNPRHVSVITGQDLVWCDLTPLQLLDSTQVTCASGNAALEGSPSATVGGEISSSSRYYGTYLAPEKQTPDLSVFIYKPSLWWKFFEEGTEMIITKKGRYIAKF